MWAKLRHEGSSQGRGKSICIQCAQLPPLNKLSPTQSWTIDSYFLSRLTSANQMRQLHLTVHLNQAACNVPTRHREKTNNWCLSTLAKPHPAAASPLCCLSISPPQRQQGSSPQTATCTNPHTIRWQDRTENATFQWYFSWLYLFLSLSPPQPGASVT